MKHILFLIAIALCSVALQAQTYTNTSFSAKQQKKAAKWTSKGKWAGNFKAAKPSETTNLAEFQEQYGKNKAQWDSVFLFLSSIDPLTYPVGKTYICEGKVLVSVEEGTNAPLEKRTSESHRRKIDFQWVVNGSECFGILEHETATPKAPYNDKKDVIHYNYNVEKLKLIQSKTSEFFLFFPEDWHIAKVNNFTDDQNIRVIVCKIDYVK